VFFPSDICHKNSIYTSFSHPKATCRAQRSF
jgi:hypothetical protein